jgi:acyl-CoA thioester hydrolase
MPPATGQGSAFEWPVRVYWEDTDAGGIVFYANYLKFFERARTEWLRSLGLEQQRLREQLGGMFVVTDTQVRYQRPARLDDLLLVTAELAEAGRASLTIRQSASLRRPASCDAESDTAPALLCEGSIRIGWVDAATLRPQRIPTLLLDALRPLR